jgi:6-pyruvoyltetrahydropterin/6-carboxytetrahydropterin synthase
MDLFSSFWYGIDSMSHSTPKANTRISHTASPKVYRLHIRKESLKFAAAHMTVFPDGTKEGLHGHNYQTEVEFDLVGTQLEQMVSFSTFKESIRKICQTWDEKVLIPRACPFLHMRSETSEETEFVLCGRRYVLPVEEVVFLPIDNVTTETLSEEFCKQLVQSLPTKLKKLIYRIQVRIDESPGQGCAFSLDLVSGTSDAPSNG